MLSIHKSLVFTGVVIALASASPVHAIDVLKVTGGEVTVLCPLTVGGSFEAKTNAVSGEVEVPPGPPGVVGGSLEVQLNTLSTGIGLRDRHLRETYLEVTKGPGYAIAILDNIRIDRTEGAGVFRGTLTLHGQKREVAGTTSVQKKDGQVRVSAEFMLKVSEFEIAKPTYLGIGVRDEVQVKVSFATTGLTTVARR
jgi:polyisoprenoid-binding protein YceI